MPDEHIHIGRTLRDLRRQRHMTGEKLGKAAGISQSRISKIETGSATNVKIVEVEKLLNILQAPATITQRIRTSLAQPESVRMQRFKTQKPFIETLDAEAKVRDLRVFTMAMIPALLQTTAYREAFLRRREFDPALYKTAMQTVIKRQDELWNRQHRYHFLVHEAALYTCPAGKSVQLAQLDRVERLNDMPNIRIGVIPLEAGLPVIDICSFALHDDQRIYIGTASSDIMTEESDDLVLYRNLFRELEKLSDYGDAALVLIRKAMSFFS